ncbi:hypothetical protein ACEWY4_027938 [Coilia grayii]|uniref:CCHC-type domain-containing protein n=1 Tax=Coilia grayii TaxID=363190 RepID=A0ABD1INR5_9TELE
MQPQGRQNQPVTRSRTALGVTAAPPVDLEGEDTYSRPQSAPPDDRMCRLEATLSSFIRAQQARDERWEREAQRQDQRWMSMQHQFRQLQILVDTDQLRQTPAEEAVEHHQAPAVEPDVEPEHRDGHVQALSRSASTTPERRRPASASRSASPRTETPWPSTLYPPHYGYSPPKMSPYSEDEDIEHYLTTFERIASANRWPTDSWAVFLVPLLSGKARAAYVAMDIGDSRDYAKLKQAILTKYEIDPEAYRHRFRAMTVQEGETAWELQSRLSDLYSKWMCPSTKTKEQIGDTIILEQFLRMLNPELKVWVMERNPQTSKQAAELAEAFIAARRHRRGYQLGLQEQPNRRPQGAQRETERRPQSKSAGGGREFRPSNIPHTKSSPHTERSPHPKPSQPSMPKPRVICHGCGQPGHIKPECPLAPLVLADCVTPHVMI